MSQIDTHHDQDEIAHFGFWLYIMSDCLLFAALFATFVVLHDPAYAVHGIKEFIDLKFVFAETMFLLASSFTFGMAILSSYHHHTKKVMFWMIVTMVLGGCFVAMELYEFAHLIHEGNGPAVSGAMSSFFALVGTHGLHVSCGLIWMLVMLVQLAVFGVNSDVQRRLGYLSVFWTFLDIVWIFVFSVVYLMGAL